MLFLRTARENTREGREIPKKEKVKDFSYHRTKIIPVGATLDMKSASCYAL